MTDSLEDVAARHRALADNFTTKTEKVTDWDAPAPVAGWTARDVVRHLVEWSRGMFGSAPGVSFGEIGSVDVDPVGVWRSHAEQMQLLLDNPKVADITLSSEHFGNQPLVQAISNYYLPDVFMHTWDLARASGQQSGLDQATCASMLSGMEEQEEWIRASGQFGTRMPVAEDASSEEKLMAFIGRDPNWTPPAA